MIHHFFPSHSHTRNVQPTPFSSLPVRIRFTPSRLLYRHSKLMTGRSTHFCESALTNSSFQSTDSAILSCHDVIVLQNNSIGHRYSKECSPLKCFTYTHQLLFLTSVRSIALTQVYAVTIKGQWRWNQAADSKHPPVWGGQSQQLLRSHHLHLTTSKPHKHSPSVSTQVVLIDRKCIFKGIFLSPS